MNLESLIAEYIDLLVGVPILIATMIVVLKIFSSNAFRRGGESIKNVSSSMEAPAGAHSSDADCDSSDGGCH